MTKILHHCSKCKNDFKVKPIILTSGHGCRTCYDLRQSKSQEEFLASLNKISRGDALLIGKYVPNSRQVIRFKSCGHTAYSGCRPSKELKCAICSLDSKTGYRKHLVKFGRRTFLLQGYEKHALSEFRARRYSFSEANLKTESAKGKPTIIYKYKGKEYRYFPDFFYAPLNLLVEVKSPFTLGIGRDSDRKEKLARNKAKAKACMREGYNFELMVFKEKSSTSVSLPSDWFLHGQNSLRNILRL
jgi:hypothetical protein